ncbi:MAG: multidrug transporter [Pseudomonadales bacterium]|nr:multidrug transporter [Pseudomonadales bacterium]
MKLIINLVIFLTLSFGLPAQAGQVNENPGAFTMVGDLLVARPIGLGIFSLGSLAFVATLPFSVAGGNVMDAGKVMVLDPGREVFVRCLGCRRIGRKEKIGNE